MGGASGSRTFDVTIPAAGIASLPSQGKALSDAGGGTLYIEAGESPVLLPASPIVLKNLTNVRIVASAGAQFKCNANNSGITTAAGVTRYPAFIFDTCTDTSWEGGSFTEQSGSPGYTCVFFPSNGCVRVKIRRTLCTGISAWPILVSPTYQLSGGSLVNSAGITDFEEEENTFVNCGNTTQPDGGGVRLANDSNASGATFYQCQGARLGRGTKIINSNCFGYDILNSTQYGWSDVDIEGYTIDFGTPVASPQKIGINFEKVTATQPTGGYDRRVRVGPGFISGGYRNIQVQTGWSEVTLDHPTCTLAYTTNIYCDGTITGLIIDNPDCSNGNQAGSSTGDYLRCGLFIGCESNAGTMSQVTVIGGRYYDDQATATQRYGVVYGVASGSTLENAYILGTAVGMYGNVASNAILQKTGGTFTNVTVTA